MCIYIICMCIYIYVPLTKPRNFVSMQETVYILVCVCVCVCAHFLKLFQKIFGHYNCRSLSDKVY